MFTKCIMIIIPSHGANRLHGRNGCLRLSNRPGDQRPTWGGEDYSQLGTVELPGAPIKKRESLATSHPFGCLWHMDVMLGLQPLNSRPFAGEPSSKPKGLISWWVRVRQFHAQ